MTSTPPLFTSLENALSTLDTPADLPEADAVLLQLQLYVLSMPAAERAPLVRRLGRHEACVEAIRGRVEGADKVGSDGDGDGDGDGGEGEGGVEGCRRGVEKMGLV